VVDGDQEHLAPFRALNVAAAGGQSPSSSLFTPFLHDAILAMKDELSSQEAC
jgi:hypothetical protein